VLTSVLKCTWVKCIKGYSNRVPSIIRRYVDRMNFAAYVAFFIYHVPSCSFGSFFLSLD